MYVGQQPSTTFDSGIQDRFTGLTTNTVTLTHDISSEVDILVVWNNIVQDSSTYSVGGTGNKTLTLGGTLSSGDVVTVYYTNKVMQSVNPTAGSVNTTQLADNAITLAKMASGTDGNIISYDASGNPVAIATGNDGQVLTSTGAGSPPAFEDASGGANTPYFQASITSNQTLVNDTSTRISFDRADVDSASGFNTTYNKYTIPTGEGGYWHIGYGIAVYGSNDSQINNINIYPNKGGSDWISFNSRHQGVSYYRFDSHCPRQFHAEKSFIGAASAGDEITITAVLGHTGGGSNTLSVGEYYSVFWGYKLAGT